MRPDAANSSLFQSRVAAVMAVIELPEPEHHPRCKTKKPDGCDCYWRRFDMQRAAVAALNSIVEDATEAFSKAEAQATWRSEPEIAKTVDDLDEALSMLSQNYSYARTKMPDDLAEVVRLAVSVVLRVKSHFRCADASSAVTESHGG